MADLTTAYNDAAGRSLCAIHRRRQPRRHDPGPRTSTGRTLVAGDQLGRPHPRRRRATRDAVFIFQIGLHAPHDVTGRRSTSGRRQRGEHLLAGRQLGDARARGPRSRGTSCAVDLDLGERRCDREGPAAGPHRRGDADQRQGDARARCAAGTEPTATSPGSGTGTAPGAISAPRVLDVSLSKPAVVGRDTAVVVDTINTRAPVSGMSVQVGSGRDVFGASACRPADSRGIVPRAFRPGTRTRLSAPLRFNRTGPQKVLVRVDSGGCSPAPTSVYHTRDGHSHAARRAPAPRGRGPADGGEASRDAAAAAPAGRPASPTSGCPPCPTWVRGSPVAGRAAVARTSASGTTRELAASSRAARCSACSTRPAAPTG